MEYKHLIVEHDLRTDYVKEVNSDNFSIMTIPQDLYDQVTELSNREEGRINLPLQYLEYYRNHLVKCWIENLNMEWGYDNNLECVTIMKPKYSSSSSMQEYCVLL